MSVRLAVRKFEALADGPRDPQGRMGWAASVCVESRTVHVATWRFCPDPRYVAETVLPLLRRAHGNLTELAAVPDLPSSDRQNVKTYANNVELRIKNILENYLQGRPSAFIPDDRLSEPLARAI